MKYRFNLLLAAVASAGFLFCLSAALGIADGLCVTQGCEVYRAYSIAGISLYWVGAALFLVLGLFSLRPGDYRLLVFLTGAALAGNLVFLAIQFLLWPCVNCLIVAALLGGFAWCLALQAKSGLRILCFVWLLLFSANLLSMARDGISPWPVLGENDAEIRVFFSPSCPACRQAVEDLLNRPDLIARSAFYPLAKDAGDRRRIALLSRNLARGMAPARAFAVHWHPEPIEAGWSRDWRIIPHLWRNKIHFAGKGATRVPLIISSIPMAAGQDHSLPLRDPCSMFSGDSEICGDEPLSDPFENLFR